MKQTFRRFTAIALCFVMIAALLASCGEPTPTQPPVVTHVGFNGNTWNDNVDTGVNAETVAKQDENGYYFVDHALALNKLDAKYMTEISLSSPIALTMGNDELKASNRTYYANANVKYVVVNVTTAGKLTVSKANVADFMAGKAVYIDAKTVDATVGEFKVELDITLGLDETIVIGSASDTAKIASYTVTTDAKDGSYTEPNGKAGTTRIAVNAAAEFNKLGALFTDEEYATIDKYVFGNVGEFALSLSNYASYTYQNANALSNKRLTSVTVPIAKTMKLTGDQFKLTINVIDNATYEIKRTYPVYFAVSEYGWEGLEIVFETFTVDITNLNIVLAENESISFLAADDTLMLATASAVKSAADVMSILTKNNLTGVVSNVGKKTTRTDKNTSLLFNVSYMDLKNKSTLEDNIAILKAKEVVAAEQAKEDAYFDALRAYYSGKTISVMGDSISTYYTWNTNTKNNSTTGKNAHYYQDNSLTSVKFTYWMRVMDQLDMGLCVNNAWSGCRVYDPTPERRATIRATEMHNDNGTPRNTADDTNPDIILMYVGINDLDSGMPFGDLSNKLKSASAADYNSIIKDWMNGVLESTENGTKLEVGTHYKTFEQGYAIMLYNMTQKYKDAKIVCCTLIPNKVTMDDTKFENYNRVIKALAAYFGAEVADFQNETVINRTNYEAYTVDPLKALHPNPWGHDTMADSIIMALARMANITK